VANPEPEPDAARLILHRLKAGEPPPIGLLHHVHVGREPWLAGMNWYLGLVRDLGVSELRVIVGDYGSGKTHFLRMTGQLAFRKNKTSSSPRSP
jgi:hypothetical protein